MSNENLTQINLQSIIDALDDCFVIIDKDYKIVAANKTYCDSYNTSKNEIIGQNCYQVSHHSDTPCHLNGEDCPHKKVFETRSPHQVIHIHYDRNNKEECVRIKGTPVYSTNGELFLGETFFPVANSEDLMCNQQRMVGTSSAFLSCVDEMTSAATSDIPVLLTGESGVGKELAARYIHNKSSRKLNPFIAIDCASIAEGIFESELFGHERGAFTGCVGRRNGLLESADHGTLLLDEIDEIPSDLQGRLLRALETGSYRRLGGREDLTVDFRLICSSSNDLLEMVARGAFRADLYHRIAGITIHIPPLRERSEDIELLAKEFLTTSRKKDGAVCRISDEAIQVLKNYNFPGNIRELKNILSKAVANCNNGNISPHHLKLNMLASFKYAANNGTNGSSPWLKDKAPMTNRPLSEVEATYIESLLHQYKGHRAKVAEELRISERTLYRKLKQYNLHDIGKNRT